MPRKRGEGTGPSRGKARSGSKRPAKATPVATPKGKVAGEPPGNGKRPLGATPVVTRTGEEAPEPSRFDDVYGPPSRDTEEEEVMDFSEAQGPEIKLASAPASFYLNATASGSVFRNKRRVERLMNLASKARADNSLSSSQQELVGDEIENEAKEEDGKTEAWLVLAPAYFLGAGAFLTGIASFMGLLASHPGWGFLTLFVLAGGGVVGYRKWGHLLRQ